MGAESSELGSAVPGLLAVDHVGLAVPDLDAAIAFHTDVLGLVLLHREENADADVAEAMIGTPAGEDAAQIQLLAAVSPESPIARFLERSGPGLQQLAYRVADVETAAGALRARGLRLLYDSPRTGTRGSLINFVHPHDTGGVLIELVQPAPHPPAPSRCSHPDDPDGQQPPSRGKHERNAT